MCVGDDSDTHDNLNMIMETIKRLNDLNVDLVLHAGDYVSHFTAKPYSELRAGMIGVYGNNCVEREKLRETYAAVGKEIQGNLAEVEASGRRIAQLHGHDEALLSSLLSHSRYDVVVHGHNHQAKVSSQGKTVEVNLGEVCGYVSGRCSLAVIDVEVLKAEVIDL